MLETSPAIRIPRIDEIPNIPEVIERLNERKKANIVEGYVLHQNSDHDLPFKFYAEININNSRLWKLFKAMAYGLPENLSCIYNIYDEETKFSSYLNKEIIINELEKFELVLTKDCNIEFGLIYQVEDFLEEIFVSECKYIKFWSVDENRFRSLMSEFGLFQIENLNFIDEFPKVVEPLKNFHENAIDTIVVVNELDKIFESL